MSQIGEAFIRVRPTATGFGSELDRQAGPGLRRFERQLNQSNRELGRFSRGALVGTGALGGLGRAAAFASTSFIGGAGLIFGIKSTIKAAMESQVVLGQTENAVKRAGLSWDQYGEQIQKAALAQAQLSGFDDERLLATFSTLVRRTGDVNKALQLNALAANIARGRNIELEQATQLVLKATLGMGGALRRLGIDAKAGASSVELLRLLNEKYAGSAAKFADTAAGAQARFNVALQNTQETIGMALLPTITRLLDKGTAWLNQEKNQERIQRDVNKAVKDGAAIVGGLTDALRLAKDVAEPLVRIVGGLKNAVELLLIAMVVGKVRAFAGALGLIGPVAVTASAGIATLGTVAAATAAEVKILDGVVLTGASLRAGLGSSIAASGVAASTAATRVSRLRGALLRLGALSAIVLTIDLIINRKGVDKAVTGFLDSHGLGFLTGDKLKFGSKQEMVAWAVAHAEDNDLNGEMARKILTELGPANAQSLLGIADKAVSTLLKGLPDARGTTAAATPLKKSTVSRDVATSTALAKAQADGNTAAIKAAAEARLKVIDNQIAFALKLEGKRGKTKQLEAALQKFYSDEGSTQGIIDQITAEAAAAQERAAAEAKTKAEQAASKAKTLAEQAARAREKAFLDSVQIKERTLRTAVKASHDGKAADKALLTFYRAEAHDARLSRVARSEFAEKAVDEQERENQVTKTRADKLIRGEVLTALGGVTLGVDVKALKKAESAAAKLREARLKAFATIRATAQDLQEGALGIARQTADLAAARAGGNQTLLDRATELQKKADQGYIKFYAGLEKSALKREKAATTAAERQKAATERQQAAANKLSAQIDLAGLKKKTSAASGYTLEELFKEAGSEQAMYGSNIGGAGTPLSSQDARGQFAGIIGTHKTNQTTVVQNFYGPMRPNQAMNDARASARNLK